MKLLTDRKQPYVRRKLSGWRRDIVKWRWFGVLSARNNQVDASSKCSTSCVSTHLLHKVHRGRVEMWRGSSRLGMSVVLMPTWVAVPREVDVFASMSALIDIAAANRLNITQESPTKTTKLVTLSAGRTGVCRLTCRLLSKRLVRVDFCISKIFTNDRLASISAGVHQHRTECGRWWTSC